LKKLLLIDDDAAFRELLHMALQVSGFEVDAVEHGEAGLRHLRDADPARPFDLIIVDFLMPIMDGLRFLRSLKQEYPEHAPPVIVLTAIRRADLMRELSAAGAKAVIAKPIELSDLVATIEAMTDTAQN
jgi:DNA-binding response OmpR family regulator